MTPRKQSRRRSGAGGCITSASRRAEKSLSSTHKSVRFQTTQKDLLLRAHKTHAFARLQKSSSFSSKCREKSPVPPPTTVVLRDDDDSVVVVVVSSRQSPTKARASPKELQSSLCVLKCFLLFPPMFFPPSRKKKRKKKRSEI